jgi:phage terminase large subunit GpA-like protein
LITCAAYVVNNAIARGIAPSDPMTVSAWADDKRILSEKGSSIPGKWRTSRNPPMREIMDCMSKHSRVHDMTARLPIQIGKTEIELNIAGYTIDHDPGPMMIVLPDDISLNKWIQQKLNPLIAETPAVKAAMSSTASRDSSNQSAFKDFKGGQLYMEHGKTATRLALTSARTVLVDELDKFVSQLATGEDPLALLRGRFSAFPSTYKFATVGSPGLKGISRLDVRYEESDQREYRLACPHCDHKQALIWAGLHWNAEATACWYACAECGACIDEHHKTRMIMEADRRNLAGESDIGWIPRNPDSKSRGYHLNCLYYQFGMGPRWLALVHEWIAAQKDPALLQVFIQERLAESWEDPSMRAVKQNVLRDRAEPYRLRVAQLGVLAITAGVDTQDNRLAVTITGWGRGTASWTIDWIELPGDPANDDVWNALTDLLNRPIEHINGALMVVEATAIDAGGHRTEDVKNYVRQRRIRRPLCIFGAVPNNAPVLSKGKLEDVNYKGKLDKRGVMIHHVGTVAIKHLLYSRISTDAEKQVEARLVHLSDELPQEFFGGLVSEVYNPRKNRFEKRSGVRNEPLDVWVYSHAATHHPELRLHRLSKSDWDAREARLLVKAPGSSGGTVPPAIEPQHDHEESSVPAVTVRAALDAILNRLDRWPTAPVDVDELRRWREASSGTPDETQALAIALGRLNQPSAPIAAMIDASFATRLRQLLLQREPIQMTQRQRGGRGMRHGGL